MKSEEIIELIRYFTNEVDELKKKQEFFKKKEDVFIDLFAIRLFDIEEKIEELANKSSKNDNSYIRAINAINENIKNLDSDIKNNNNNIKNILNEFLSNL